MKISFKKVPFCSIKVTFIDVFTLTISKAIVFSKSWPLFAFVGLGHFLEEMIAFLIKKKKAQLSHF